LDFVSYAYISIAEGFFCSPSAFFAGYSSSFFTSLEECSLDRGSSFYNEDDFSTSTTFSNISSDILSFSRCRAIY